MAVRLSMGATPARLLRLLLIEACALGVLGGIGALLVGRLTLAGLLQLMPPEDRTMLDFGIEGTVLVFTLVLGLGTSGLFGIFPAVHGVRSAAVPGVQASSSRTTGSRAATRFRTSMATAQIALATALLALAGLFLVSLMNVGRLELGIQREGLVTFRVSPYLNGYSDERARAFFGRLEEELRASPDVVAVSASTVPILSGANWGNIVTVEGFDPGADARASWARIGVDYFRTLGIPLLAGREFAEADTRTAPQVAIVNESFARTFAAGSTILGKRMAIGDVGPPEIEIVGIVRDSRYSRVTEAAPPQFFLPQLQADGIGALTFYVRAAGDARAVAANVPSVVARLDANLPLTNMRTMEEQIWESMTANRVLSTLSSAFASLATLLAAIGLYGVLAYSVAQRLREFGIRIALGATGGAVRRLVLTQVGRIVLVGGAIGVALALGLGRLGQALFFGVESAGIGITGAALVVMMAVALCAGALPARRAAGANPVEALRAE